MLPVPAQGPLVLVDPLGKMIGRNVSFVDDVDSVNGVGIFNTLLELSDDLLVVGVEEVS